MKFKALADNKWDVPKMTISIFDPVENIPAMFSKGFFLWVIKSWACLVKSYPITTLRPILMH